MGQGAGGADLYDPAFEKDSCGFGLIAQLDDRPSRAIVDAALDALRRMTHRGAVAADGKSGDGCGLLLRRPEAFLRVLAREAGIALPESFASGIVFLPHDEADAMRARVTLEAELVACGLLLAGWREVPVDVEVCGAEARRTMPAVAQVYVGVREDLDLSALERLLFQARRRAEIALSDLADFYVVSLSAHVFAYKGMVMPGDLPAFFKDLARPELATSAVTFHQRFSTNTMPRWPLAQPFRFLAHNGEINSIQGNRNWMRARGPRFRSPLVDFRELQPVVSMTGSDSQTLDNMLECLLIGGMDLLQAMRILIPPAWRDREDLDGDIKAFYEYYQLHMEPWDGPAGIVLLDGRYAACTLDRNGLRPARYLVTRDRHVVIASEAGVFDVPAHEVVEKGRLGPGQMVAVDLLRGEFLKSRDIDAINRARAPFKRWMKTGVRYLSNSLIDPSLAIEPWDAPTLAVHQKLFNLSREERDTVLKSLAESESEATGSMGDDTPVAVMSGKVRSLYDYFRQSFAQVTNPPIDSLREHRVMSLMTQLGRECNVFEAAPQYARQIVLNSPILSQRKLKQILSMTDFGGHVEIDINYPAGETLEAALSRFCEQAEDAVRHGTLLVFLTDRHTAPDKVPAHALLAVGAVHQHLTRVGLRAACNIVVETATARDPHHFACLIGFGATAIQPYLAYQSLLALVRAGQIKRRFGEPLELGRSFRRGIRKGMLKILSKMGISCVDSYRGAQLFEVVGLAREVVERCFTGTPSRIEGAGFAEIESDQRQLCAQAWNANSLVEPGGLLKFMHGGEYHMYNPDVIARLQAAVRSGDYELYREYADVVNARPASALRDLMLPVSDRGPIPLDEVEPVEAILKRFDSAGMSLGALSPEAHEALAIAMNRLGARSNSGEGGEDPARYGTERMSKIKQVASGRFGVTPEYLINAEVLQIKMAQGAKPGEGGQLPGHKVDETIARLRFARPGIGLISPPPHHDIYSIEDLAQLIYDLKEINPEALVSVKLVSHAGVGTIAAGVVKAYADLITISGHDGGTGASPLSSIKYAGTPWELGLAEAHQTLKRNSLRHKVRLQTDGGLKTGLDVIKAAALGAESFGFGTAPMVALGCKYLRICHLNNCATGVATQLPALRKAHFIGLPEMVEHYFRFVAMEVRERLAQLGLRSMEELIGRTEFLRLHEGHSAKQRRLDLTPLLSQDGMAADAPNCCIDPRNPPHDKGVLAARMLDDTRAAIAGKQGGVFTYAVSNRDRSIGARLSGEIARRHGNLGMAEQPLTLKLTGSAGQSFGAWNAGGLILDLTGEANDYVGKGMAGGKIVVRPPADAGFVARETVIVGNTCLYGATGGEFFAAGRAGERFGVRNSGALAVVEGTGDHCCEYMTGGCVLVLGRTGLNFGAGFTGGFAYVLDMERDFVDRYNPELIDIVRISTEGMENHLSHLRQLLKRHHAETGSAWARELVDDYREALPRFWLVKPKAASLESLSETLKRAA
ncbi:MAG: glutamate synthase large subunit [Rhodanobacteraceae bacterium]|nr:glutamate synthase large subunit [Rhodanobacteraceae bacterium]